MKVKGVEYVIKLGEKEYRYPIEISLDFLSGKWKSQILWHLRKGPRRFSELRMPMPRLSERVLSQELKNLCESGLVLREAYAEVPPRVEYSLTAEGESLLPALNVLAEWGRYKSKEGTIEPLA